MRVKLTTGGRGGDLPQRALQPRLRAQPRLRLEFANATDTS